MELTVRDRLLLLGLLPAEGDITTLRIVRKLREDLSFSEADHEVLGFTQADGMVKWDEVALNDKGEPDSERQVKIDAVKVKDVTIGLKGINLIVHALKKLSDDKKLGPQHLDLYDQFVANDEE